jgi:hypothetical protein
MVNKHVEETVAGRLRSGRNFENKSRRKSGFFKAPISSVGKLTLGVA